MIKVSDSEGSPTSGQSVCLVLTIWVGNSHVAIVISLELQKMVLFPELDLLYEDVSFFLPALGGAAAAECVSNCIMRADSEP